MKTGKEVNSGVPDVPSDDSEEELSWKSSEEEEVGGQEEAMNPMMIVMTAAIKILKKLLNLELDDDENDDDDDEEDVTDKDDKETSKKGKGGDEVRERGDSENESDDEEEQESRLSEEVRIREEEYAEELYRDVNINQGRGLQIAQNKKDTHVILTPVNPDDQQESSSMSSFVSSMLNPLSDEGVESIFATTSSQSVSLVPPTPILTPSTIATITTSGEAQIPPPTIPSINLENLPTFNSAFRFEERLRILETSFNETPEESEEESNDKEDQDLRLSEEARIQEEEDADELYRDVNINQGRGVQVTQNVKDSHVTLTPVNPDGPQESSSMSSFMTSMLNPIRDVGVDSIFTTTSSLIVSLQSQTPIMTPSTIATITTSGEAPIPPPTIPSIILENLPTFNSAFRFDKRLRSLETSFSEYRQTNPFVDDVFAIPGIVQQYMTQQMTKAVREAVQIHTDRHQDSLQRENDEFLRNIDENMKKIIKGQVKNQVKEQVSRILPRIEESV
nr:hypothetical protein [Tanacetum cinerariifolium]